MHIFGRAHSDLQLCSVELKTLASSVRYSTCEYVYIDFEIQVKSHSRSSEPTQIDLPPMTSY